MENYYIEPNNINQLVGINMYIQTLDNWFNNLEKKFTFILFDGNYGCGKSILAKLYLQSKNYNIMYFDMTFYKNKQTIFNLIKESFNKFNIISYFNTEEKKKTAFIIDNISNSLYKNDIIDLHNLFVKNNTIRPVIFIGKYNKIINFPKKKIQYIKIYSPNNNTLQLIAKNIINKYKLNISNITLNILISKCQNDIRKLLILLFNNNNVKYNNKSKLLSYKKDIDFNLFENFKELISYYTPISLDNNYDNSITTNYIFHQNLFNIFTHIYKKKNINNYLFLFYKEIYNSLYYNNFSDICNQYIYSKYIYISSCKNISYIFNKLTKKCKNNIDNVEVVYPKYSYINNQKNMYKKYINLFKKFDFYNTLNESNFILFCQSLFYNEEKNHYILNQLKKSDVVLLKKIIFNNS